MNVYKILRRIRTTLEPDFTINKQETILGFGKIEKKDKKRRISVKLKKMR